MDYNLAPSNLTYLYEDCKRCFYLAVKQGIRRPSILLPQVLGATGDLVTNYFVGKRTEYLSGGLPRGVISEREQRVRSKFIPSVKNRYFIDGRFDISVKFDAGGYGIVDFKFREEAEGATEMYGRQLHAYAWALEHPAPGELHLSPITRLGLLYFAPNSFKRVSSARYGAYGPLRWIEVPVNYRAFSRFLKGVIGLLEGQLPPAQTCQRCDHCQSGEKCRASGATPQRRRECKCCQWCNYLAPRGTKGVPV